MGFEVVYCFKCQRRLSEGDFQKGEAFRIGVTTTCRKCSPELIAALPAEQQAALLSGPVQVRSTPQALQPDKPPQHESVRLRRGPAEPPAPRQATATHAKHLPEKRPAASPVVLVAVGAAIALGLVLFLVSGGGEPRVGKAPGASAAPTAVAVAGAGDAGRPAPARANEGRPAAPPPSVPDDNPRRAKEAEDSLRAAREHRQASPDDLEGIAKRFQVALWDAERTPFYEEAKREHEAAARRFAAAAPKAAPSAGPAAAPAPSVGAVAAQPPPPPPPPALLTAADLAAKEEALRREHEESVRKALDGFERSMAAAPDAAARAAAVERLGKAETDPRIASAIVRYLEDEPPVREKAIWALVAYNGAEQVVRPLVTAVLADRGRLKETLWSLYMSGQPSAAAAVAALLKEKDFGIASNAAWVLDTLYDPVAVESLIVFWSELEAAKAADRLNALREALPGSLVRLTGQSFRTPGEYRAWWSRARAAYKPLGEPRPAPLCQRHQVIDCPAGARLPPGTLACEVWFDVRNVQGDLAKGAWLHSAPSRTCVARRFESPSDIGDYYASRMRGYLVPPADGEYRFWINADDVGELYLSPDERPEARDLIARIPAWAPPHGWDQRPEQASKPVLLKAGRRYYIEAHLLEQSGSDVMAVAWQPPSGSRTVIPGRHLVPFACSETAPAPAVAVGADPSAGGGGASPTPAPPAQGLVGWWRFDEAAGDVAEDASGHGRTARLVGAVGRTLGKFGRGVRFAGDGGHVELPSVPDLDGVQGGSYTLAAWFRPEAMPEAGMPSGERFAILVKAGRHLGLAYNHEQRFVAEHWPASGPPLVAGAWETACPPWAFHHVAVTVDREKGRVCVYLDGERKDERPLPPGAGAAAYASTPWRIGVADPAGARRWAAKGVVDDVRIYDRALQAGEIAGLLKGPPEAAAASAAKPTPNPAGAPAPAPVPERKPGLSVARLVLVDVSASRELFDLKDGMSFRLSALPTRKLSVRADTRPAPVGSVVLELDGQHRQVESSAPYSLFGDDKGKQKAGTLAVGGHVITATPYTEKGGEGVAGQALSIRFTVAE